MEDDRGPVHDTVRIAVVNLSITTQIPPLGFRLSRGSNHTINTERDADEAGDEQKHRSEAPIVRIDFHDEGAAKDANRGDGAEAERARGGDESGAAGAEQAQKKQNDPNSFAEGVVKRRG